MTDRSTVDAPELAGFEAVRFLGGGGFADVFLYKQRRPSREVAIKVLKSTALDATTRADFEAEADLMASVSAHPFIVTIFGADISTDGRPFLVMEYYRNEHMGVRAQQGMSVAEVLRTGVQVGSAVETLHQAGIVHRDIKPANILVSEFRKPGLTDFGIAGVQTGDEEQESRGASIPYAPPEVVSARSNGDRRADVYSLAATLYSLLARRTPFETGNPPRAELIQRILTAPAPALDRPDVPRQLELLLQQAMSKDPEQRPQSAEAFASALQSIEREMRLDPTPLEVREIEAPSAPAAPTPAAAQSTPPETDHTRARVPVAKPQPSPAQSNPNYTVLRPPVAAPPPPAATVARPAVAQIPSQDVSAVSRPVPARADVGATVVRPKTLTAPEVVPEQAAAPKGTKVKVLVPLGMALAAIGVGVVVLTGGSKDRENKLPEAKETSNLSDFDTPGAPSAVSVQKVGARYVVTWKEGGGAAASFFRIVRTDANAAPTQPLIVTSPPIILVGVKLGERPCVTISAGTERTGGLWSVDSPEACAP